MPARSATLELNARETEILRFAAKGLSDRAIASKLGLSAETVRWYNKRVYEKLDAANRTDAVSRATELGLLGPALEAVVRHPIRYVDNDGVSLAYQVIGNGASDVLFIPGFVSHIEVSWETPDYVNFFEQLGRVARVITFDKRGVGLSDRVQGGPSLDQTVRDALCVLDATGSRRAFVFGTSEGGAAALLLASMFPDRVRGLILFGATPKVVRSGDEPVWSAPREAFDQRLAALLASWGEPWAIERFAPSRMHDKAFQAWWPRCLRAAASPSAVKAVIENAAAVDIRGLLREVETRTLVMSRTGDRIVPIAASRYLADHLPNARLVELNGDDHVYFVGADDVVREVAGFIREAAVEPEVETRLAILLALSTDAARPTATQRAILAACQASQVKAMGGGFVALFESPRAAVSAARRLRHAVAGAPAGVGLHVGACRASDGEPLKGVTSTLQHLTRGAAPGEILVSATLCDILAGSGTELVPRKVKSGRGKPPIEAWAITNS